MRMKKPPAILVPGFFLLLFIIAIGVGWRMAKDGEITLPGRVVQSKGPMETSFCGPLMLPLPPPAFDSPDGFHLYATNAVGVVHPLPAMQIVDQLGVPQTADKSTPASTTAVRSTNETGLDDVQAVGVLLEEYRRAFGAMPVGELNDEIVRRLQGENPKGIAVLPKIHPAINAQGELMDRWGTPYRFHPESAWEVTIRSAGGDRKMWTSDDILSEAQSADLVLK